MMSKTEIKVKGLLDRKWKDWFDGFEITYKNDLSILSGVIKDDSHMYGTLDKIRDLNLKLISLNTIKETNS